MEKELSTKNGNVITVEWVRDIDLSDICDRYLLTLLLTPTNQRATFPFVVLQLMNLISAARWEYPLFPRR